MQLLQRDSQLRILERRDLNMFYHKSSDRAMPTIHLYKFYRDKSDTVTWESPDGNTYKLDTSAPSTDQHGWVFTQDAAGKNVMAYRPGTFGADGTLVLALGPQRSLAATLLHDEDDFPRKYYFATDGGNNNPLRHRAFILCNEGEPGCPIAKFSSFQVMVVE